MLALVAGCSGNLDDGGAPDDAHPPDCSAYLTFMPEAPIAGMNVRAFAHLENAPGVPSYAWDVSFAGAQVATTPQASDNSQIEFAAPAAGIYRVRLGVTGPVPCPSPDVDLNVAAVGGKLTQVRLHVTPPGAPPFDRVTQVTGGAAFSVGTVALDPGVDATGLVRFGSAGAGAYLRFSPLGMAAAVEAFSNPLTGAFNARVLSQEHEVLVIPLGDAVAPQRVRWTPNNSIDLSMGSAVGGTVRAPGGGPLAGATVRLAIDGVPSTLGTTSSTGAYSVLVMPVAGAPVTVEVVPPASSGLPRLVATAPFDLTHALDVLYSTTPLRDLAGTPIRRGASPVPNARLVLVGTVAGAGTIGGTLAGGVVRIAATANPSGILPATLAPARALTAVVEGPVTQFSVSTVDLGSAPAQIDAPAQATLHTRIDDPAGTAVGGVDVDLVPLGALAMAGVTGTRARSLADGTIDAPVAAGAHYELRFRDPGRHGAPERAPDVTSATVAASYRLKPGLRLRGRLIRPNGVPIGGASVQILCSAGPCSGLDRDRPLAEATSADAGDFEVAVPDPGTL